MTDYSFVAEDGAIVYDKVEDFIKNNAIMANSIYMKYINIQSRDERYSKVAATIIKEAERTTAGFMVKYYKELKKL